MKQNLDPGEAVLTMWWIGQLRVVGHVGAAFFVVVAAVWMLEFRESSWQSLLAISLGSFAFSWAAAAVGVLSLKRRLAEGNAVPGPKRERVALLARSGIFLGVLGFVLFFLISAS